jgi:hypothetical protein
LYENIVEISLLKLGKYEIEMGSKEIAGNEK